MNAPNPDMILLARDARGINQKMLAQSLGISQGNLSKIEQGIYQISQDQLESLSKTLKYPKSFFFQTIKRLPVNQQFHRKRKTIQKKYLAQFDSQLTIRRLHIKKLLTSVEIQGDVPKLDIEEYGSPETIANKLRSYWKINKGPIHNLIALLEDNGIIVIYTDNYDKIDGMAIPDEENIPIIYLNKEIPADRQRFTLAHELGHIVMHSSYIPKEGEDVEKQADQFASEFLMPSEDFRESIIGISISIKKLAQLKQYWKCSMASILYKLNYTRAITPNRNKSLNVQISQNGFRRIEPTMGVTLDEPTLLKDLVSAHLNELEYSKEDLAKLFSITPYELEETYFKKESKIISINRIKTPR